MFTDRVDAGRRLTSRLQHLLSEPVVVLGLPRGGVPVASEVARSLGAPLDVILVRKLGVPSQPELGMGAIGEDGVRVTDPEIVRLAGVRPDEVEAVEARERVELARRAERFRGRRPRVPIAGRTAIVVDDGIATGSTARAACEVARAHGAARVVLAVPVAPPGWEVRMGPSADGYVCIATPEPFHAIGQFYDDFTQTSDEEVVACLDRASGEEDAGGGAGVDADVEIPAGEVVLGGHLTVPPGAGGVVVFVHGSGSSRHSPRNRFVAEVLHDAGLATLLFDLLTTGEARSRHNVFDIGLLADRLAEVVLWLRRRPEAAGLPVGLFGASTGAAAALWVAAEPTAEIAAVVSRGGRPDLAADRLGAVRTPTLLVVGGRDEAVLELNRQADALLGGVARVEVVPGATHLFEEPGTLEDAAARSAAFFVEHLRARR